MMALVIEGKHSCLCKGVPMGPLFRAPVLKVVYKPVLYRVYKDSKLGPMLGDHGIYFGFLRNARLRPKTMIIAGSSSRSPTKIKLLYQASYGLSWGLLGDTT